MRYQIENERALLSSYEAVVVGNFLQIETDCVGTLKVVSDFDGSPLYFSYNHKSRSYQIPHRALVGRITMCIMKENGELITLQPLLSFRREDGKNVVIPDASDVLHRLAKTEVALSGLQIKYVEMEKKQNEIFMRIEKLFEGYNI